MVMENNFDFNSYYDSIHKPYFALEKMIMNWIPAKINIPFTVKSNHVDFLPFMNPTNSAVVTSKHLFNCLYHWKEKNIKI